MSEINKCSETGVEPVDSRFEASRLGSGLSGRRRFIKLGASAVPVAMTLTSQPVMAWHCDSTSAWGSAQVAGNVGSAKTRLDKNGQSGTECWYIANWVNDSKRSSSAFFPWEVLANARYSSPNNTSSYAKSNCKVSDIFPRGLFGTNGSAKVWRVLQRGSSFAKAVIVARLNSLYATAVQTKINACIVTNGEDQVLEMARLGSQYSPPNHPNVLWSMADIEDYLRNNWLAV